MENWLDGVFLKRAAVRLALACLLLAVPTAYAAKPKQVIDPKVERRDIAVDDIDAMDFEIGAFAGVMNIEDFGTNPVYGISLGYHVTEDFFLQAAYGRTKADETSFEKLGGGATLLDADDRNLSYYNLSLGVNLWPGEAFIGSRWAFTSSLYLIGGIGNTTFADDDHFTWNVGAGYQLLLTDWLALHIEARDHVFNSDLLGADETTHNLEFSGGLSVFF
jgi:outer membrane beta-barrel protein